MCSGWWPAVRVEDRGGMRGAMGAAELGLRLRLRLKSGKEGAGAGWGDGLPTGVLRGAAKNMRMRERDPF